MTVLNTETEPTVMMKWLGLLGIAASLVLGLVAWSSLITLLVTIAAQLAIWLPDMSTVQIAALVRSAQMTAIVCGGVVWLALAIGSIGFHGESLGMRRSLKILAWTIGIEMVLIVLGQLA